MNLSRSLGLLTLIIALYILWQIKQLLLLVFTAIVLATALNQLVKQLQRWKLKRSWAIGLSVGILLVIFSFFLLLVVPPFVQQFEGLIELLPSSITEIEELFSKVANGDLTARINQEFKGDIGRSALHISSSLTKLSNTFQEILAEVQRMAAASAQVEGAISQIADGAKDQLDATQRISQQMEETSEISNNEFFNSLL